MKKFKPYITEQAAELLIKDWHYNVYSYMDDVELEKLIKKHIEDWFSGLDSEIPVSFDLVLKIDPGTASITIHNTSDWENQDD